VAVKSVLPAPALITLAGVIVVLAVGAVVWPSGSAAPAVAGPDTITVSRNACGTGWTHPMAGYQELTLHNADANSAEVDLVAVATGKVYGEVDGLGPDTSATMRVSLAAGGYAIRCLIDDVDPLLGPTVTVTGQGASNPGAAPVSTADLLDPLKQYQAYTVAGVSELVTEVDELAAAVRSGTLDAARAAWLPAHLTYERLGAAYGAFGDFDRKINGTTAGLPGGVADPDFTGFHRVEYGLWHGEPAATLAGPADQLDSDVHALRAAVPRMQTEAIDLGLRAHEIMENSVQFELTGQTDYGSDTSLATVQANLAGDREVVSVLRPLLVTRYPQLSEVDSWSNRLDTLLDKQKSPTGDWTPVNQLGQSDRERINGALSQLTEVLAPIAALCEPRRVS
jgi:iron uptake system component EfeO